MNEYPGLVDSHCHLWSLSQKGLDPKTCLQEFFDAGGRWLLDVAVSTREWAWRTGWSDPRIGFTAGFHPSEACDFGKDWEALEEQTQDQRCLAVGEIGLDWYRGRDNEVYQRRLFREQLSLARQRRLPVVIHNREADRELLEDLDAESWDGRGIMHCFSSDRAMAKAALDRGFWISFAGNLTYPGSVGLRELAAWLPADRLLVETDAPYLAPQPVRGRPNRPVHGGHTARCLAELRGWDLEHTLAQTATNYEAVIQPIGRG